MNLLNHYPEIVAAYPEYITQKQFCEVCGVCHKTAYNLERRGEIPYKVVDTPTGRIHHIKLIDALAYLYKKDTLYLAEIEQTAQKMVEQTVAQMARAEGVTEALKATDPLRWTGLMNNFRHAAEEMVLNDLISERVRRWSGFSAT